MMERAMAVTILAIAGRLFVLTPDATADEDVGVAFASVAVLVLVRRDESKVVVPVNVASCPFETLGADVTAWTVIVKVSVGFSYASLVVNPCDPNHKVLAQ
ncbi:hypothetical protein FRB93_000871 [Tulasnella sp. JGI-2019a]|nr:hypothetical protein FRB93_000871 [Tulasnella sp. JGI-2019a]